MTVAYLLLGGAACTVAYLQLHGAAYTVVYLQLGGAAGYQSETVIRERSRHLYLMQVAMR